LTRLSATALGALLIGLPAGAARADEPSTAAEARQMAAQATDRAAQYREMGGGAAYKTGLVQRAELEAATYTARAEELESPPPALSPEAEHYAKLAAQYRAMGGGAAYKTGLVQRAEADQRRAEEAATGTTSATENAPTTPNPICMDEKPVIDASCIKGAAGD
jgi:hypothetical protein